MQYLCYIGYCSATHRETEDRNDCNKRLDHATNEGLTPPESIEGREPELQSLPIRLDTQS